MPVSFRQHRHKCMPPSELQTALPRLHVQSLVTLTSGAVPCRAREKAEKQLDMILRAGITTFICLQVQESAPVCLLVTPIQHLARLSHTTLRCLHDAHQVPGAPGTHGLQRKGAFASCACSCVCLPFNRPC